MYRSGPLFATNFKPSVFFLRLPYQPVLNFRGTVNEGREKKKQQPLIQFALHPERIDRNLFFGVNKLGNDSPCDKRTNYYVIRPSIRIPRR